MSDIAKTYPELPPEIIDYIEVLEGSNKLMAAENVKLRQALEHVGDVVIGMKTSQEKAYALEVINLALEQSDE